MSKYLTTILRSFALFGLVLGLAAALLASPGSAAAATCNPVGMGPQACTEVSVYVYDRVSGRPIDNAKVTLIDSYGNVTPAYDVSEIGGRYAANVTPDTYRVVVTAPAYFTYSTTMVVKTKPTSTSAPLRPSTVN